MDRQTDRHLSDGKKVEERVDSCGTETHATQLYMQTLYQLSLRAQPAGIVDKLFLYREYLSSKWQ